MARGERGERGAEMENKKRELKEFKTSSSPWILRESNDEA